MLPDERLAIKTLNRIGVDTRYISLYKGNIYISNRKFSKFSRKKEEEFNKAYPNMDVLRSSLLQKISIKMSRTVKGKIKPRQAIYVENNDSPENIILHVLLEPYKRKYGIQITGEYDKADVIASAKCLDDFASEYMDLMTTGSKITDTYEENTIYPLEHIYHNQINDWINTTPIKHTKKEYKKNNIINFLEKHIPNAAESIKQSVAYLDKNNQEGG